MTDAPTTAALSLGRTLLAQGRIIGALMLHDIRSRMGGSAVGFLMFGIGWPLSHILALVLINAGLGRTAPYGGSVALWYAAGVVPFLAFQYMGRFMSLGVALNRPLLSYPIVKVTDILFSRAVIEVLNTTTVVVIVLVLLWCFDVDFMPRRPVQAGFALLSMMLLGLGFGAINAVIAGAVPFWITGYALMTIIFWLSSGIIFVPDALPEAVRVPLSYLPWLQGVEWMRSAYYEGFGDGIVDRAYLVWFGVTTLCLGLVMERLMRGKLRS